MIELTVNNGKRASMDFKKISSFSEGDGFTFVFLNGESGAYEIDLPYEVFKALYEDHMSDSITNEIEEFAKVYRKIASVQETVGNMVEIMRGFERAALYHVHDTGTGKTSQPMLKTQDTAFTTDEIKEED